MTPQSITSSRFYDLEFFDRRCRFVIREQDSFYGIIDEQLRLTSTLVNDIAVFDNQLKDLQYLAEPKILKRLNSWLYFFNDHFNDFAGVYSHMIVALTEAAKSNELFRTQTNHEFTTSLELFKRIIGDKRFLRIIDLRSVAYLLQISLIFGKYPGMVIRSITSGIRQLKAGGSFQRVESLFQWLFVKYETPHYLLDNLNNLSLKEIEAFMFVLQGNNLRNFPDIPLQLSRKETWVIQNRFPRNVRFDDEVLLKGIVCSKLLLGAERGERILVEFMNNCKPFQFNLQGFIDDLSFWKKAFAMCCKIDWDEVAPNMGDFLDYLEYRRYVHEDEFLLKGRSAKSLVDGMDDWHEAQAYKELKKLRHLSWVGHGQQAWTFEHDGNEYCFTELRSGQELFKESQNLKHCAYSYISYCANGHTSIWSLNRKEDSFFKPYITVEVRESRVVQARGLRNRELETDEEVLVQLINERFEFPEENEFEERNYDEM